MKFIIFPILILLTTHIMTREELLAEMQVNIEALDGILGHHPDVLQDLDAGMTAQLQEARNHLNKKDNKAKAEEGKRLRAAKKAAARAAKLAAKEKRIKLKEQKRLAKQAAKQEQGTKEDISKHQFGRDMAGFVDELIDCFNKIDNTDETPISISELKNNLGISFGASLVGKYIHSQLCVKLDTYKDEPTRANLAKFFIDYLGEDLNEYTYWADLLKKNKTWKKEYRKDRNMDDILPKKKAKNIVAVLESPNVEDKKHPNHPGVLTENGLSKEEYARYVQDWAELAQDSMRKYKSEKIININSLLKTITAQFSSNKYDAVLSKYIYKVVKNYLNSFSKNEVEGTKVASVIADAFEALESETIKKYYDYNYYQKVNIRDFDGTILPTVALFDHWLNDAQNESDPRNDENYKLFQEKMATWTKDIIKTISNVKEQDTLFYASKYRQKLKLLSSNYGDKDALMNEVMYVLQDATSLIKIKKGDLLSNLISQAIKGLDQLATGANYGLAIDWKNNKFTFPLSFGNELKTIYNDIQANAKFSDFENKIDTWATTSKDLILETKIGNTAFRTKDFSKELEHLFSDDISGLQGIGFIYYKILKPALKEKNNTIKTKELHAIWQAAMESAQENGILLKEYEDYASSYYPEGIELLIDSMEFLFPSVKDLEGALKASKINSKRQKLNTSLDTLVINYNLNWLNRKTLLELASTSMHDEIPAINDAVDKGALVLDWITNKIKELGGSTIDDLQELGNKALVATFRTDVASDNIQLHLPIKINKTYKGGKSIVFADIGEINDGAIKYISKLSPYSLDRISVGKIGKTIFTENTAIHRIQMVIDIDDMELSKAVSAGAVVAGAEIGVGIAPQKYTLSFEVIVESIFEDGELTIRLANNSTVPTNNDCSLLNNCDGPDSDGLNLPAFSE